MVCDQILVEPGTNKFTLVGLFSAIWSQEFPCIHGRIAIFLALTDGYGSNRIVMKIVDSATEEATVWQGEFNAQFKDPREVVETYCIAGNLSFPRPGEYRLRAESDDGILMERRIMVIKVPTNPTEGMPGQQS
jgi:hypothetical protein